MSEHRADAHSDARSRHPKTIRRSYLTFLSPDARPQNDFIDQWRFSIDEPAETREPAVETFEATPVDVTPVDVTPIEVHTHAIAQTSTMSVSGQRAMAQAFAAQSRHVSSRPHAARDVTREDLLAMRRELIETAKRVDRALAVIDRWLDVRRSA